MQISEHLYESLHFTTHTLQSSGSWDRAAIPTRNLSALSATGGGRAATQDVMSIRTPPVQPQHQFAREETTQRWRTGKGLVTLVSGEKHQFGPDPWVWNLKEAWNGIYDYGIINLIKKWMLSFLEMAATPAMGDGRKWQQLCDWGKDTKHKPRETPVSPTFISILQPLSSLLQHSAPQN